RHRCHVRDAARAHHEVHHPVVRAGSEQFTGRNLCSGKVLAQSFLHLGAGLSVGLSGLAAGFAIGIVGDAGVRGTAQQPGFSWA
ncbi:hypothetical protein FQN60_005339, partial [Etheostoma spectabile]